MIYHQTKQEQQHDILTVLSTFASIYDHVDISNNTVELHNELCIYKYTVNDNNKIFTYQLGNLK